MLVEVLVISFFVNVRLACAAGSVGVQVVCNRHSAVIGKNTKKSHVDVPDHAKQFHAHFSSEVSGMVVRAVASGPLLHCTCTENSRKFEANTLSNTPVVVVTVEATSFAAGEVLSSAVKTEDDSVSVNGYVVLVCAVVDKAIVGVKVDIVTAVESVVDNAVVVVEAFSFVDLKIKLCHMQTMHSNHENPLPPFRIRGG